MSRITRAKAERARRLIASMLEVEPEQLFLADYRHEGLRPGCWSIALEGHMYDWPSWVSNTVFETGPFRALDGIYIEAMNGWCLGLYPAS